mmetsp:Transcript_21694/g.69870  ORF Transcript_21694/g.69870 Transcript_21694/m.69870 type:complete len:203 (-) Transcript_21694:27-635(-)
MNSTRHDVLGLHVRRNAAALVRQDVDGDSCIAHGTYVDLGGRGTLRTRLKRQVGVGVQVGVDVVFDPVDEACLVATTVEVLGTNVRLKLGGDGPLALVHLLLERAAAPPARRAAAVHIDEDFPAHSQADGIAEGLCTLSEDVLAQDRVGALDVGLAVAERFPAVLTRGRHDPHGSLDRNDWAHTAQQCDCHQNRERTPAHHP